MIIALDFGNGFSVASTGKHTVSLPSAFAQSNILTPLTDSTVTYSLPGQTPVMVGEAVRFDSDATSTLNQTKPKTAPKIFPALLALLNNQKPISGQELSLRVVDTNPKTNQQAYSEALKGEWDVFYKKGLEQYRLKVQVTEVDCYREGLGTYNKLLEAAITPNELKPYKAVINVGAGTADAVIFNARGAEVEAKSLDDLGSIYFSTKLTEALRNSGKLTTDISTNDMFKALETGELIIWDRRAAKESKLNLKSTLTTQSLKYYQTVIQKLIGVMDNRTLVGEFILTGGLAYWVKLPSKTNIKIAINPLTDNAEGIINV